MPGTIPRYVNTNHIETEVDGRIEVVDPKSIGSNISVEIQKVKSAEKFSEKQKFPIIAAALKSENPAILDAIDKLLVLSVMAGVKPYTEYHIGCEFICGDKKWRCTDIGFRTITGICVSDHEDDQSWLNGPPYAVEEIVFDEDDLMSCQII